MLEHISKSANKVFADLTKSVLIKRIKQLDLDNLDVNELLKLKDSVERSIKNETSRKSITNGNSEVFKT